MATRFIHVVAYWKHNIFIFDGTSAWFFIYFFAIFHWCSHIWRSRLVLQPVVFPSSWSILFDSGVNSWSFLSFSPYTCSTFLAPSCGLGSSAIPKEISPKNSLEKLMLKLKMQYFGCLMRRTDLLEKTLWLHGDCSHESRRCLLLGRKVMTNLDSIFKSRDITLQTKVLLSKLWFFQ